MLLVKGGVPMGRKQLSRLLGTVISGCIFLFAFVPDLTHVQYVMPALAEDVFNVVVEPLDKPNATPAAQEDSSSVFQVEILHETVVPPSYTGRKVLIYHTHTYEAFEQIEGNQYEQTERWRTKDANHNVIAVGKALAATLRAMGIDVVHDVTAFEPPTLDDAYERSLSMLEKRKSSGESYDLYIDLHRDAVSSTSTIKKTVNIGGEDVARFMVLVGQGTTGGYTEKPDWEKNLEIAQRITNCMNNACANLARDVKIKTGRFNQHIDNCCVLIECGMNTNTLDEVLAGIPYLAQAVAETLTYAPD